MSLAPVVVPDLHGELELLEQVLARFPDREYILLGDLIDRGPDSPGVVERVMELVLAGRARLCLGNHEYLMLSAVLNRSDPALKCWLANGGDKTVEQYAQRPADLSRHVHFLAESAEPWVVFETPAGQVLCSHASRPTQGPEGRMIDDDLIWAGMNTALRQQEPCALLPTEAYSVHGHVPQTRPTRPRWHVVPGGKFLMLDTGAVFTGTLGVLDAEDQSIHLFQKGPIS